MMENLIQFLFQQKLKAFLCEAFKTSLNNFMKTEIECLSARAAKKVNWANCDFYNLYA